MMLVVSSCILGSICDDEDTLTTTNHQVQLYTMIMVQQSINKSPPNNTNMKEEEKAKK